MKPPAWFPFYAQDFLGATSHWTSEERGAYLSLLCYQWREGSVPKSRKLLRRICVEVSDEALKMALSKFDPMSGDPDALVNRRLAAEFDKAIVQRASYHSRASKGGQAAAARRASSSASSTSSGGASGGASASAHSPLTTHHTDNHSPTTTHPPKKRAGGPSYSETFLTFWDIYPRKVGKGDAFKKWKKMKTERPALDKIVAAVKEQMLSDQWRRGKIPNPATWINQARWDDELPKAVGKRLSTTGAAPGERPEDYDRNSIKWEGVH